VTIDAIDENNKTISIKGSDGVVEIVAVANPDSLKQVQVGEQIVVTLIDVVAIAVDKEGVSANATPPVEPRGLEF
jgi:F0F1-type ATP synthase beta subunit